jgi:hypothetical protein
MVHPRLLTIANTYIKELCQIYPLFAVEYGFSEFYPNLSYPTEAQETSFGIFLDSLLSEVKSVNDKLDPIDKIDKEVLTYIFRDMSFYLRMHPYDEKNLIPSQIILYGVHEILQLQHLSIQKQSEYILSRLAQSSSWFDDLKSTWKHATLLALEDAILQLQNLGVSLSQMLQPLLETNSSVQSQIKNLILRLGEKGKTFAEWLEQEVKPITTVVCKPLGRIKYQQLLEIRQEGHSWSERLKIGEESLKSSQQRLQELAEKLAPKEKTVKAAMTKVREDQPTAPVLEEAKKNHEFLLNFMQEKGLLDVPPGSIDIIKPPSWSLLGEGWAGIELKEILTATPLIQLIIAPPTSAKGKADLNRSSIMLAVAHEGVAGHMSSFLLTKQRNNLTRQLVSSGTGIDDRWTFYWEEVLNQYGVKPDLRYAFFVENRKYWCALRTICDVKLHCGLMTFDECVNFLEIEGDVPPITAKVYAKAILQMPGYFSSFIVGKNRLFKLKEHVKASLGPIFSIKLFHQWVGEAGPIPYHLLKKEIDVRIKKILSNHM